MGIFSRTLVTASALALIAAGCTTVEQPKPEATDEQATLAPQPMPSVPLNTSKTLTRIGFGSCMKQDQNQSIWNKVAETNPDVFLFIGDNVYGDNYSELPGLPELHDAYALLAQSEPFAKLRGQTPLLVTWDDHDYGLNDNGATFKYREDAEELFDFVWAIPKESESAQRPGVYDSWLVGEEEGKRVQIILLDTRYFRSDLLLTDEKNAPGKERYMPSDDKTKTMLGEAQWQWLEEELKKPADLRIIASSIQVIADGHGWEAWRTLPAERERLYSLIGAAGAENVVFISGDRHAGAIYKRNLVAAYPLYEMTSSSLNAPASVWRAESNVTYVEPGPHRLTDMFYDVNFGLIDIDWDKEEIQFKLMDENGEPALSQKVNLRELRPVY